MNKPFAPFLLAALFALGASVALTAADDKSEKPVAEAEKKEEPKFDVEIKITGNDTMQYDKNTFTVTAGQQVKLTFKNIGKLPKAAMGHNVVILKHGVNPVGFATACITAGPAADYLAKANLKDVLAHTKLLGPDEEESIYFTAPDQGKYDYLCTFPGHFAIMKGVMLVK